MIDITPIPGDYSSISRHWNLLMQYSNRTLGPLLLHMPQELRRKIILDYLQVTRNIVGQAGKLQWVVVLGKGWMGLQAFKMLMEAVTVWTFVVPIAS